MSCSGLLQAAGCSSLSRGVPALLNLSVYSRVALLALGLSAFCVIDLEFVRQLLATASAQSILVALLGLCFYPSARATVSRTSASGGTGTASKDQGDSMGSTGAAAAVAGTDRRALQPTAELLAALNAAQAVPHMERSFDRQHMGEATSASSSSMHTASASSSTSYRRRPFSLRIPRVSIELTPLPRISLVVREPSSSSSRGVTPGAKWRPGMIRIKSGQDLVALLPPVNVPGCSRRRSRELAAERCRYEQLPSPTLAHLPTPAAQPWAVEGGVEVDNSSEAGLGNTAVDSWEATASLGRDLLVGDVAEVEQTIPEAHLLQFGAMLGESSSRAALQQQEGAGPVGHPSSLYGSCDTDGFYGPWEPVLQEVTPGAVQYWAWRRPLRKGLYMYMTRTVFLHAAPAEVRRFMLDDAYRVSWDNSMLRMQHVAPCEAAMASAAPAAGAAGVSAGDSGVLFAQVRFPKPMASRAYTYARRVWLRPADGGCYCLARACTHPAAPATTGRTVAVSDYASGCVVRSPAPHLLPAGYQGPSAEVLMVYFEDSLVRPGLANMGIKKGLWPMVQRTDKALRVYQANGLAAPGGSTCVTPLTGTASSSSNGWSVPPTPSAGGNTPLAAGSSRRHSWWHKLRAAGAAAASVVVQGLLAPSWALGALLQGLSQAQRGWGSVLPALEWRLFRWLLQACSPSAHRLGLRLTSFTNKAGSSKAGPDAAAVAAAAAVRSFPVPPSEALVKEWPLPLCPHGPSNTSSSAAGPPPLAPAALALAHARRRSTGGPMPRARRPASRSNSSSSFGGAAAPRPAPPLQHPCATSCGATPPSTSTGGLHRVDSHPLTEALVTDGVPAEAVPTPAAAATAAGEGPRQGLKSCSSVPLLDLGVDAEEAPDSSEDTPPGTTPPQDAGAAPTPPPPRASSFDIRLLYTRSTGGVRSAGSASSSTCGATSSSTCSGSGRASDPGCGMEGEAAAAAACVDWVAEVQGGVEDGTWRPPRPGSGGGHHRSSRLGPGGIRGGGGSSGLTRTLSSDLESVGASSRGSSRGGGGSSSSRGSGRRSGAHQRRIVVGLVQAAGVRLAHHLLTAHGGAHPH